MPKLGSKAAAQVTVTTKDYGGDVFWSPVYCAKHHFEILKTGQRCQCPPGPAHRALRSKAYEILFGGARSGGKTETGRGFLLKGNPNSIGPIDHTPEQCQMNKRKMGYCGECVNVSYVNHPRYRALVIRKNFDDLADWMARARAIYGAMRAEVTEKPARVRWPSGAEFVLGHLKDSSAISDYVGQEYHRILGEEWNLIPDEGLHKELLGSLRSTFHCRKECKPRECRCGALNEQCFLTANPDNVGAGWLRQRFVDIGPENELYTDPVTKRTRIFIPARAQDNPYTPQSYIDYLEGLDEPKRSQWLLGDWNAALGLYFANFRPKGPLQAEPPEANHVIEPVELLSHWNRAIGMDWGYNHRSVILWACQNQNDGRLHVYRELVCQETGSDEIGAKIAKASMEELLMMEQPHMPLYLSPDAFAKTDARRTIAEQIRDGIDSVLGRGSAFLVTFTQEEKEMEPEAAWESLSRRASALEGQLAITIQPGNNRRVDGWQEIRRLLRFKTGSFTLSRQDEAYIDVLKRLPDGDALIRQFMERVAGVKEVLPKLRFWAPACRDIIKELREAVEDERKREDVLEDGQSHSMDALDALRYLVMGFVSQDKRPPFELFFKQRLEKFQNLGRIPQDPTVLHQVWRRAQESYGASDPSVGYGRLGRASIHRTGAIQ